MSVKYFVRTTGERVFDYSPLDYDLLIDKAHQPVKSFIQQLKIISEYNSVLLEDDLLLCKNFKNEIEKVINENPDCIINFFYDPYDFFTTHLSQRFMWNQCTYYPKGISKKVAEEMERLTLIHRNAPYDFLENVALNNLRIPNLVYRPCLVQHIGYNSLISLDKWKDTIYFKDYIDELGIDYRDALSYQDDLEQLLLRDHKLHKI